METCSGFVAAAAADGDGGVEQVVGGERMMFYSGREAVDFRELVKDMARDLQTRIEMPPDRRPRTRATLLDDYGDAASRSLHTHMTTMPAGWVVDAPWPSAEVHAAPRRSPADVAGSSAACAFEQDVYEESEELAAGRGEGAHPVRGRAGLLPRMVMAGKVLVEFEDGRACGFAPPRIITRLGR